MNTRKLQNVAAVLVFVTWCTALLIVCIGTPSNFWAAIDERFADLSAKDGLFLALTPVISLIANGLFPPAVKDVLVFWRIKNVLPGHRAFSVHANADRRLNVERLRKRVAPWPTSPKDENQTWYRLYRSVDDAVRVAPVNRSFLVASGLASIAATFLVAGVPITWFLSHSTQWTLTYSAVAVVQYVILAFVARNYGIQLVRNVLVEVSQQNETRTP